MQEKQIMFLLDNAKPSKSAFGSREMNCCRFYSTDLDPSDFHNIPNLRKFPINVLDQMKIWQ